MYRSRLVLPLITLVAVAACDGSTPQPADTSAPAPIVAAAPDAADDVLARRQLSEQRMEAIAEIARELRDTRGGVAPEWFLLEPEVRARHPDTRPEADVLRDGWGRAFEYEAKQETDANEVRNIFTIWSRGPDGENQMGAGDDLRRGPVVMTQTVGG